MAEHEREIDIQDSVNSVFARRKLIKKLNITACPLVLGGGYDISGGATRLAWCAGLSCFFWTPLWTRMTKGIREILRCSPRCNIALLSGIPFGAPLVNTMFLNGALKFLKTDKFDVWLQLWVKTPLNQHSPILSWSRQQKELGKISLFGISTHRHEVVEAALHVPDIDVIMIRFNAAHRSYLQLFERYEHLWATKLVIAYTATKWGYLIKRDPDWPLHMPIPTAADCYAYTLDHQAIDLTLFGPKNVAELQQAFAFFRYSHSEWAERKEILNQYGRHIFEKYGVTNAYHLRRKWFVLPR